MNYYHLSFKRNEHFDEWIHSYLERVNHAFIWNEMELFESLKDELDNELSDYKTTPIYEQLYEILNHLFEYYIHGHYMTLKEINACLILCELGISNNDLASLLLEVMYVSNNNSILKKGLGESIIEIAKIYKQNYILDYIYAFEEKCHANFHEALKIFERTYELWKLQNNHYREVRNLNGLYLIYSGIDSTKAIKTSKLLLNYLSDESLPNSLKYGILYNIAMYDYIHKYYEEAYDLFMRVVHEYQGVNELSFIGSICTHLNRELPNEFVEVNTKGYMQEIAIKYYLLKKNSEKEDVLVHYIMDVLIPNKLKDIPYKHPNWTMFEYELEVISRNNKKFFNDYMKYKEYMHKICIDG